MTVTVSNEPLPDYQVYGETIDNKQVQYLKEVRGEAGSVDPLSSTVVGSKVLRDVALIDTAGVHVSPASETTLSSIDTRLDRAIQTQTPSKDAVIVAGYNNDSFDTYPAIHTTPTGDIIVGSSALPTGAATEAKQDTIIGHVNGLEALQGTTNSTLAAIANGQTDGNQLTQMSDTVGALLTYQAAGADGASNTENRVPVAASGRVFNGTTWDRQRSIVAGLDSTGTGIAAAALVAQRDDTSTTAVTENQFAPLRLSSRRALLVEGVASGTAQAVSGTVSANIISGQTGVDGGSGATSAKTQRICPATDAKFAVTANLKDASVSAYNPSNYIDDGANNVIAITPFVIDAAASGANTIVAAVAAKNHYVLSYFIVADAAVTMTWTDGTANLSGAMLLAPGVAYSIAGDRTLFKTAAVNRPISITLSAAVGIRGHGTLVTY